MDCHQSTVETLIKINSQTIGRDKLIRLLQYASKYFSWLFEKRNLNRELMVTFKNLEYSLSTARKLLRLGRFVDTLHGALKSIHLQDLTLRLTITMGKISQALFLLTDHILWLERMRLFRIDKEKWTRQSNKFWLLSILFFLVRDAYELWLAMTAETKMRRRRMEAKHKGNVMSECSEGRSKILPYVSLALSCLHKHRDVVVDTVKNGCDVFIPMSSLGCIDLSSGTIGLLGVVSSLSGLVTLVYPMLKLQPS